jgi:putative transposase
MEENVYHVYNKSIAGYVIFNEDLEFTRIIDVIHYYRTAKPGLKFSEYEELRNTNHGTKKYPTRHNLDSIVQIIAFCIMPTHIHLILRGLKENGIPTFVSTILNSYTRYFNLKHKRKGPLWEGRSKKVLIESDEQLLHLTRYIHLNPVTAYLVNKPEKWAFSSYGEYLSMAKAEDRICNYENLMDIVPTAYKKFVEDLIDYQRELAKIKKLLYE